MNNFYFKSIICILLGMFFIDSTQAQSDTALTQIDRLELDYTNLVKDTGQAVKVVSASRSSKNISDLPITIYVITRNEIIQNGYVTLVDALKSLPGIRISQPGSGLEGETFLMRGLTGNFYTKILVNNIPIQPSVVKGMPISAQLPIRQAERIEVIYGPAAAIYGSDATSGVINIITKEPENNVFSHADLKIGNNGYSYYNFMTGGKAGKNKNILNYTIYGSRYQFKDMNIKYNKDKVYHSLSYYEQYGDVVYINSIPYKPTDVTSSLIEGNDVDIYIFDNYEGTLENPEMSSIPDESNMFGFTTEFRGLNFTYHRMERQTHSSIGRTTYLFKYNNPLNTMGETINRLTLSYEKPIHKIFSTTNISYLKYRLNNQSSRGVNYIPDAVNVYTYSASDDLFAEQLVTYSPSEKFEIIGGVSFQYSGNLPPTNDLYKPFDNDLYKPFSESKLPEDPTFGYFGLNPITYYNAASFVQLYYKFKKFTLLAGVRDDYNSIFGESTNPRFAILYRINEKHSVRASFGNAYKAPSPSLAYQSIATKGWTLSADNTPIPNDSIIYGVIPNKDLEPEELYTVELGYRGKLFNKVDLDLSLYACEIDNLIALNMVEIDTVKYPLAENLSESRENINSAAESYLAGIQANLKYNNIIEKINLNAEVNFHLSDGHEVLYGDSTTLNLYRLMPKKMGNFTLSCKPTQNLYLQMEYVWMSSWYRKFGLTQEQFDLQYNKIDGYNTLDLLVSYKLGRYFSTFIKIINVFDTEYGGLDVDGADTDLRFNPQLGRQIRFGVTFSRE